MLSLIATLLALCSTSAHAARGSRVTIHNDSHSPLRLKPAWADRSNFDDDAVVILPNNSTVFTGSNSGQAVRVHVFFGVAPHTNLFYRILKTGAGTSSMI